MDVVPYFLLIRLPLRSLHTIFNKVRVWQILHLFGKHEVHVLVELSLLLVLFDSLVEDVISTGTIICQFLGDIDLLGQWIKVLEWIFWSLGCDEFLQLSDIVFLVLAQDWRQVVLVFPSERVLIFLYFILLEELGGQLLLHLFADVLHLDFHV